MITVYDPLSDSQNCFSIEFIAKGSLTTGKSYLKSVLMTIGVSRTKALIIGCHEIYSMKLKKVVFQRISPFTGKFALLVILMSMAIEKLLVIWCMRNPVRSSLHCW